MQDPCYSSSHLFQPTLPLLFTALHPSTPPCLQARLAQQHAHRQSRQTDRAADLLARDEVRQRQFIQALGVDLTKGPIKIAPRNPAS